MNTTDDRTLNILNDLIEICRDGQRGFGTAAEDAKDGQLAQLFREYSAQRAQFIREIQARVRELGGDPDKKGSITGSLHRGWIDLKAALSTNEPHAVLAECERGEDAAVEAYSNALKESLDPITRDLVGRQFVDVQAAHDHVKQLRDSQQFSTETDSESPTRTESWRSS